MRQRLLEVVHGPLEVQRTEHALRDVVIVHTHHAETHRAEQRLDDYVAAELSECLQRVGGPLARIVREVGRPAPNRLEARNLSTVRSIAWALLTARTPAAASACRTSTRKTTCSSEPRGMPRREPTSSRRAQPRASAPPAPPSTRPTIRVTGAKPQSCPRALSARSSRRARHPPVEPRTATRNRRLLTGASRAQEYGPRCARF